MKCSIYISNNELEYLLGEVTGSNVFIAKAGKLSFETDTIEKGSIRREEAFQNTVKNMCSQIGTMPKQVDVLVVDDIVLTKMIDVPILPHKKLLELVKRELEEFVDGKKEYVYDYSVVQSRIPGTQAGTILCGGISREVLMQYKRLLEECGVHAVSLDTAVRGQVRLMEQMEDKKGKTFIVGVMDGFTLRASLYVKGNMIYHSTSRVTERDNLGLISELTRVLSSFIQFNQSQKNDTDVEAIYLCGMHKEEEKYCQNISITLGINTQLLDNTSGSVNIQAGEEDYSLHQYVYPTGNLFRR